jgi:hypothetical protein
VRGRSEILLPRFIGLDEASDRFMAACHAAHAIDWKLTTTLPNTLAGIAATDNVEFLKAHPVRRLSSGMRP